MSDQDLVVETVRDILGSHEPFVLTPDRPWDAALWSALADAGLTGVGLPEDAGGSGGELADAVDEVAAPDRDGVDEPIGVDGDAAVRHGAHVREDVAQPGHGHREPGLGGSLADDGVIGVLAVVDGAAG